jgi:FG-GAP-like repeat
VHAGIETMVPLVRTSLLQFAPRLPRLLGGLALFLAVGGGCGKGSPCPGSGGTAGAAGGAGTMGQAGDSQVGGSGGPTGMAGTGSGGTSGAAGSVSGGAGTAGGGAGASAAGVDGRGGAGGVPGPGGAAGGSSDGGNPGNGGLVGTAGDRGDSGGQGGRGTGAAAGGALGQGGQPPSLSFAPPVRYRGGSWAMMIGVADLNGDGALDVAAADFSNSLAGAFVMLNNGDGTLGAASQYLPGEHMASIAIGDFTGDGHPDLTLCGDTNVALSVNSGNGTFSPPSHLPVRASSIQGLDADGDGRLDLVAGGSLFLNQGGGTFAAPLMMLSGLSLEAADLDRDGKTDLAGGGTSVYVLINRGGGTFAPRVAYPTGSRARGNTVHGVAIGDVNRDGWPDIAAANDSDATVSVLLNQGDGTFTPAHLYAAGPFPTSVKIGDLNGDGWPELVVANSAEGSGSSGTGYVGVYRNQGDGTFASPEKIIPGVFPESVALGDLDGDQKLDILAGDGGGGIDVAINLSR